MKEIDNVHKSVAEIREEIRVMNSKNMRFATRCKSVFSILAVVVIMLTLALAMV